MVQIRVNGFAQSSAIAEFMSIFAAFSKML